MIVITQPTYLPWSGYFDLIDRSEVLVFLDDVQFHRRSWQQKNRIILNNEYKDLTIPIKKKGLRHQKIKDTQVFNNDFLDHHIKIIYSAYCKTKYFKKYFPIFEELYKNFQKINLLSKINIALIKKICNIIGIDTNFEISSSMSIDYKGSEKLAKICKKLNKFDYLTNEGAMVYLKLPEESKFFLNEKINIYVQNYKCVNYNQRSTKFLEKASILDLIFNEGDNSLKIIRSGRNKDKIFFSA